MNNDSKNILDVIEDKLKKLEQEKDEIENLYGIDENILNEYSSMSINEKQKSKQNYNLNKLQNVHYENLPKLDVIKKDNKTFYKIPDSLQDSLKYEPKIKDLFDEKDFEPSFTNLNNLKTNPTIPKGFQIKTYVEYLNEDYIKNYCI